MRKGILMAVALTLSFIQSFARWGTPVKLNSNVNTGSYPEDHPFITADGKKLYFVSFRPGGFYDDDIWVSTWNTSLNNWGPAVNIGAPINTNGRERSPSLSPDGKRLYYSTCCGGYGGWEILYSDWDSVNQKWGTPQNMGPNINSPYSDFSAKISADGKKLYFSSEGRGHPQTQAIYTSVYDDSLGWQPPVPFPDWINKSGTEEGAYVSADGKWLFFVRWGGYGRLLYMSQWQGANWSIPVMLDTNIVGSNCWTPFMGMDSRLYFTNFGFGSSTDIWVVERMILGDLNRDGQITISDVMLELNKVFLN